MKKLLLIFTLSLFGSQFIKAQSLSAGDVAIIGYNSDGLDGFAFVTLANIPANEIIYFTEDGWNLCTNGWQSTTDVHYSWTAPSGGVSAGTVIKLQESNSNQMIVSGPGTVSYPLAGSQWNLRDGDPILMYQSSTGAKPTSPDFITGVYTNYNYSELPNGWNNCSLDSSLSSFSSLPPGLTNGENCISLSYPINTEMDNWFYSGPTTGSSDFLLAEINNSTNWYYHNGTPFNIATGSWTFSVTTPCTDPDMPIITPSSNTISYGESTSLNWSGANLNDATNWHIYTSSCGSGFLTSQTGTSLVVSPTITTTYYIRGEDGAGCVDESTGICGSTTITVTSDNTSPVFENSTPSSSSVAQTSFTLATKINEAGNIYYVIISDGASAPSSLEVKAGTGSGGTSTVTSGNTAVTAETFSNNFSVTGLTAATSYDVYVVAEDDEDTPNLQESPTKIDITTASLIPLNITGLTGDNKIYDGTTAATTSGTPVLLGVIGSDNVSLGGSPVFTFASASFGVSITITTTGYIISGTDVGNYTLTQPTFTADITTHGILSPVTEGDNTGVRLSTANADNYGNIGSNAIDLSYSFDSSTTYGATGDYSTAMGRSITASGPTSSAMGAFTTASGDVSTAMGYFTTASAYFSTAMGRSTTASDYGSLVIGQYNSSGSSVTNSADSFSSLNTAFVIGNGTYENNSDAFKVLFNGNTTVSNDLTVNGDVIISSDARLKANIVSLGATLAKLLRIDGKSYTMKKDGKQKIGVLAQDIQKVFPELVSTDDKEMLAVNYQGLVPVLINALKEQDAKMKEQQAEIDKLKEQESKFVEQEKRLKRLEELISKIDK